MSFSSLNNNNTFNADNDEKVKKNFQKTLDDTTSSNRNEKGKKTKKIELNIQAKKSVHIQSVTFSITADQLDKISKVAREKGFKGRSDLLSAIIDAL